MPTTYTQSQDEFKVDAIDTVHINPSLMEGVNVISSLFGPRSAVPISRYAPFYVVNPSISGDPAIPSTLTCNPGVVAGSPSPSYSYQWKMDGVDLSGEANSTLVTDGIMDDTDITCVVEALNYLGMVSGTSNEIHVRIVEPIRVEEQYFTVVTGLEQIDLHTNMLFRGVAVSGMSLDDYNTLMTHMGFVVEGLGIQDSLTHTDLDCYTVMFPTFLETLTMVNPGAELGTNSGWTVTQGTLSVGTVLPASGTYYFRGSATGTTKYHQDVEIPSEFLTDLDAGKILASITYVCAFDTYSSQYNDDYFNCYFQVLDDADDVIATFPCDGRIRTQDKNDAWTIVASIPDVLPPLSRSIRFQVELVSTNTGNGLQIDNHSIQLWSAT